MKESPAKHLIVRFQTGAHWSTGPDAVATVRVPRICRSKDGLHEVYVVHIADTAAWAKAKLDHPQRGEVWLVTVGERSPWGSTYKLNPVRRLSETERTILPNGVDSMELIVCIGSTCTRRGSCQIAALLRARHPGVDVQEATCVSICRSGPVVFRDRQLVGPVIPDEASVDQLVNVGENPVPA